MDALVAMKGTGKMLVSVLRENDNYHLLKYCDGSMGIFRDQMIVGLFEPQETEQCFLLFRLLINRHDRPQKVMVYCPDAVDRLDVPRDNLVLQIDASRMC